MSKLEYACLSTGCDLEEVQAIIENSKQEHAENHADMSWNSFVDEWVQFEYCLPRSVLEALYV